MNFKFLGTPVSNKDTDNQWVTSLISYDFYCSIFWAKSVLTERPILISRSI